MGDGSAEDSSATDVVQAAISISPDVDVYIFESSQPTDLDVGDLL